MTIEPDKVECTLLVPQVSGLISRGASVPVSDINGGAIFILEVIADGQATDGTRPSCF